MDPLKYGDNPVIAMNSVYIVSVTPLTIAKIVVKGIENHVEIFKEKNLNNKIITMDIETLVLANGKMKLYFISWFDGTKANSYYLTDFNNNHKAMIGKAIKDLMKVKYDGFKIYLHNFGKFDGIFLLKQLNKLGIITLIINKGRFISIKLSYSTNKESRVYSINFRDSYQLLLDYLNKLAKCFKVDTQKGIFPHRFVTEESLNYIGAVPSI
uniref:Probable DNA polymerase n=1 Tax=Leucoagaricus naucinus TaxID=34434 RepID=A0A8F5GGT1_9AGAR|nr:DNA polymerase [Leucoagaricus naucinus]